jgi:glutamate--cysteine ligase
MTAALGPMARGLLYDATARDAATALTAGLSFADRQRLAEDVPRQGFAARAGKRSVGELAAELVAIARDGLGRVAPSAVPLLAPVADIAGSRRTQADAMIDLWRAHAGDRAALVRALAHPGLG